MASDDSQKASSCALCAISYYNAFSQVNKSFKALASDDSQKASSCAPLAGMQLGSGLFRSLSVEHDQHGVRLPITAQVDCEDDAVAILRWSFMVTRMMRKIYAQDATVRFVQESSLYVNTGP